MDEYQFHSTANAGLPADLLVALTQPFAPSQVELRVGKREQRAQKWFCLAVPFVPRHFYEDRLNALIPGHWSTSTPSLVETCGRLVIAAQVQIGTVVHTDYGERPLQFLSTFEETSANAPHAQAAFEQAFVGACQRFGMGRYLADLPREWVPYDPRRRRMQLSSEDQAQLVLRLYREARIPLALERQKPRVPLYPGWPPYEPDRSGNAARSGQKNDIAARLRKLDLDWVRERCDAEALQRIYRHFQISRLEDLTDRQLVGIINGIHAHRTLAKPA